MTEITVAGYPRSGNVWLCRLLGDALDVPVVGIAYGRDSLAAEGQERPNPGYVRQAHLWVGGSSLEYGSYGWVHYHRA